MNFRQGLRALLVVPALLPAAGPCSAVAAGTFEARADGDLLWLDNGAGLRAAVAPARGGELAGLAIEHAGRWHELLYRGLDYSDAPGWRGKAPLLWPATGISIAPDGTKNRYLLDGQPCEMPFHGFARLRAWEVVRTGVDGSGAFAVLSLRDDADSRRSYPFAFVLQVTYRLEADHLRLDYQVTAGADNTGPMPFSIGNHVTFRAPLTAEGDAADVAFETTQPVLLLTGEDKAFRGQTLPSPFTNRHALSELPRRSGVSLGGGTGPATLVVHDPSGLRITLSHEASAEPAPPAARFTLWADTEDGFFSPEPWVGTQNSLNSGAGLVRLAPGQRWTWSVVIIPSWPAPTLHPVSESPS